MASLLAKGYAHDSARSRYITMVSNDGLEFVVLREAAVVSPTIRGMLRSGLLEAQTGRCTFPEISGVVLEKVAVYLSYNWVNRDQDDVPDMEVPVEMCLELLVAADFFGLDNTNMTNSR